MCVLPSGTAAAALAGMLVSGKSRDLIRIAGPMMTVIGLVELKLDVSHG